jgi:hypothetical protein
LGTWESPRHEHDAPTQPAADKDAQITVLQEQLQTTQKQVRALEASAPPVEKQSAHVKSL